MFRLNFTPKLKLVKYFIFNKLDYLILTMASITYIVSMFHLAYLKYYTFNATFYDLGINNEALWLLSHGFISNYFKSHFNLIYPLQFEKGIMFLILPMYSIYPHPVTLIFLQSLFLGITVFPIYIASNNIIKSKVISVIIALSYLVFFPNASTNLFDFHFISLFPFFYLMSVMFWTMKKTKLMCLFSIITATINPLTLILTVFLLIYVFLFDLKNKEKIVLLDFSKAEIQVLVTILGLIVLFILYHVFGTLYFAGVDTAGGGSTLTFAINYKLELFLFLFGALAFLPLFEPKTLFLIAPYAGFVLLSSNSTNFVTFGLMYTELAVGPLYFGLLLGVKSIMPKISSHSEVSSNRFGLKRLISYKKANTSSFKIMTAFIVVVIVFTFVYFPYSPINNDVQGGYFNGNHESNKLVSITPEVLCLHKIISMIPSNASVLTLNDIPQVSGREYIGVIGSQINISYKYILFNSYFNYFTQPNLYMSFINNAISNESYGILAETPYNILLEKNYTLPPQLFTPFKLNESAGNLSPCENAIKSGNVITDNFSNVYMWFGPYITLFPGIYNFTFYLSSGNVTSNNSQAVYIEVMSGHTIYASKTILRNYFEQNNTVVGFTLTVELKSVTGFVQFRGLYNSGEAKLSIHSVYINQISI